MMNSSAALGPCSVCSEELPPKHHAECVACLQLYHIRMTETDMDAKDCGYVYLHEEDFYIVFLCNPCYEKKLSGELVIG